MFKKINFTPASFNNLNVDAENLMIKDVIIAEQIETKDNRRLSVDDDFMNDFVKMSPDDGVVAEINHNWFSQVGVKLGRIKNVRFDKDSKKLIGDLQINKGASLSPIFKKDPVAFIVESLKDDAKSLMLSMKVSYKRLYAMVDGKKETVKETFSWLEGYKRFLNNEVYDGLCFMELGKISSVDVVSEGALTNSMFSADNDDNITEMLNKLSDNEGFKKYLESNFANLIAFNAFFETKYKRSAVDKVKELFGLSDSTADHEKKIADLQAQLHVSTTKFTAVEKTATATNTELATTKKKITELTESNEKQAARIIELEAMDLEDHPGGGGGDDGGDDVTLKMDSVTLRAHQDLQRKKNKAGQ